MYTDLSWDDAIQRVLTDAKAPLHYTEIAERVASLKLRRHVGANPKSSVCAAISVAGKNGPSPYVKVDRGIYTLKSNLKLTENAREDKSIVDLPTETGALHAFGMFWRRDSVYWSGKPRVLGRQTSESSPIDFYGQVGVYLLHDRDRVIYVGRATDSLGSRLKSHTSDRLSGRWDRFSWFGLKRIDPTGQLQDCSGAWDYSVIIETMEALLIESIEPPLNRKRGDNFSGSEYLQHTDPAIEASVQRKTLDEISRKAGLAA